jgi:hypothetical protein
MAQATPPKASARPAALRRDMRSVGIRKCAPSDSQIGIE